MGFQALFVKLQQTQLYLFNHPLLTETHQFLAKKASSSSFLTTSYEYHLISALDLFLIALNLDQLNSSSKISKLIYDHHFLHSQRAT
jgi:hypothetical protein